MLSGMPMRLVSLYPSAFTMEISESPMPDNFRRKLLRRPSGAGRSMAPIECEETALRLRVYLAEGGVSKPQD